MTLTSRNFAVKTQEGVTAALTGYQGDLSAYLRSLLRVAIGAKHSEVSYQLLRDVIVGAFRAEPLPLEKSWFEVREPDDFSLSDEPPSSQVGPRHGFDLFERTIQFTVADFERMREAGQLDQDAARLYFGIESPTGASWYNFDPETFWECSLRGYSDHLWRMPDDTPATWHLLADLIVLGRIYE